MDVTFGLEVKGETGVIKNRNCVHFWKGIKHISRSMYLGVKSDVMGIK